MHYRPLSLAVTESNWKAPAAIGSTVMPSENYRYYCLDGSGHLHGTEWISVASDEDAVAQVQAKHPDGKFEIWQGQRLVAQLGFAMKDDCIRQTDRSTDDSRVLRETGSILARPRPDSFGDARYLLTNSRAVSAMARLTPSRRA